MDSAPEGTLRFQSEIVDPATDKVGSCTFFVDSGSSVNLTRSWCLAETKMHEQPLTVKALKDDLQVERCGEVILLSPREDYPARREAVGFLCCDLDAMPSVRWRWLSTCC